MLALLFEKKLSRYELRVTEGRPTTKILKEYLLQSIEKELRERGDRLYMKKLLAFEDREVGYMVHRMDRNYQAAL